MFPSAIPPSFYVNEPKLACYSVEDLMEESQVPQPKISQPPSTRATQRAQHPAQTHEGAQSRPKEQSSRPVPW